MREPDSIWLGVAAVVCAAAMLLVLFLAGCGADFAGTAGELVDAGAEVVTVDAGAELVDVPADVHGAELVDVDAGAELVDVAGELAVDRFIRDEPDAGDAETGPPPLVCMSIDGIGQCGAAGPWPYICCRASPCECCNQPNCGVPSDR